MIIRFNENIPAALTENAIESELLGEHVKLDGANLISISSRPGMGKTALALNMALDFAMKSKRCVYIFSYEMLAEQVYERLLSILSGVDLNSIRKRIFSKEELKLFNDSTEFIKKLNIIIDDDTYNGISDMEEKISRIDNLGMIVVDYLGMMFPRESGLDNYKEIATLDMRNLSRKLSVPILFTHQLSKHVEYLHADNKPEMSDVENYIAHNADTVILLYRKDYYCDAMDNERTNLAEVTIALNKFGKDGKVYLHWDGNHMKFEKHEVN